MNLVFIVVGIIAILAMMPRMLDAWYIDSGTPWFFAYASLTYSESREMKRQTVEANRAWISVDAPIFQQAAIVGEPVQVQMPYTNVGRGPGLNGNVS